MTAAFRLRADEPSELDIHAQCARALDRLLAPPALWCCYPAGAVQLTPQQHARYALLGLKRGFPDILIFHKGTWGIELKRPGGRLSKTRIVRTRAVAPRVLAGQDEVFPALLASGGFRDIAVARSVDELLAQCAAWNIPMRGRITA